MRSVVDKKFLEWAEGKSVLEARINIFEQIRDIPYALVPELISAENYPEILNIGKGSCTPKHLLLANMYERLGITVLLAVYPFLWADVEVDFPPTLRAQAESLPLDHHLACKVEINGKLVLVDATVDLPLGKLGLPVTKDWDGESDMTLAVEPSGEEQIYHLSEAGLISNVFIDELHLSFFDKCNLWLEEIREKISPLT